MQRAAFPTVTVAGNVARGIPAVLVYSIVVILSSYFFIAQQDQVRAFFRKIMPKSLDSYVALFKKDLKNLIGGYFLAQFRIMRGCSRQALWFWVSGTGFCWPCSSRCWISCLSLEPARP